MVLRNFERRLEHLVESTFARVFKSGLNPIEIGRRIVREIDANQSVAVDGALAVPNHYWVYISSEDYERFQEVETPLTNELIAAARTHIVDENYRLLGPVSVVLVEATEYPEGTLQVQAQWREGATTLTNAELVMETGERFAIGDSAFSVGRLPNCSLVLSDENVSRNHAVIQRVPGGWMLTDHGSTNGTTVNAAFVTEVRLQPGDQIVFGATPATFQAR
ncbi:MAG: DUF3662 and FHA domain-containing protein [Acidimicrobiales bacterium]